MDDFIKFIHYAIIVDVLALYEELDWETKYRLFFGKDGLALEIEKTNIDFYEEVCETALCCRDAVLCYAGSIKLKAEDLKEEILYLLGI